MKYRLNSEKKFAKSQLDKKHLSFDRVISNKSLIEKQLKQNMITL